MVFMVNQINKSRTNSDELCCSHIPLVSPVNWCFGQFRDIGNLKNAPGSTKCAQVAAKIGMLVVAIIAMIPSMLLACIGLSFSCVFKKNAPTVIPANINPTTATKPTPAVVTKPMPVMVTKPMPAPNRVANQQPVNNPVSKPSTQDILKNSLIYIRPNLPAVCPPQTPPGNPQPPKSKPTMPAKPAARPSMPKLVPTNLVLTPGNSLTSPNQHALIVPPPPPLRRQPSALVDFDYEDLNFYDPTTPARDVLEFKALMFFAEDKIKARKSLKLDFSHLGPNATNHQIIDELLEDHRGFNVGESHNHLSSKKFFIDNMAYFKTKNVRTIFFEGLDHQLQSAIDGYMDGTFDENDCEIMSIKEHIANYSKGFNIPAHLSDWEVIKAAKANGIRISLIDYSDKVGGPGRLLRMNYVAAKVMARDLRDFGPDDKFIGFIGWNHLAKANNDPNFGMSELFQCPAVIVRDNTRSNTRHVVYEKIPEDNFVGNIHVVIFDKKP